MPVNLVLLAVTWRVQVLKEEGAGACEWKDGEVTKADRPSPGLAVGTKVIMVKVSGVSAIAVCCYVLVLVY